MTEIKNQSNSPNKENPNIFDENNSKENYTEKDLEIISGDKNFLDEEIKSAINFITSFDRQKIINSKLYQKNKGYQYFNELISFGQYMHSFEVEKEPTNPFEKCMEIEIYPDREKDLIEKESNNRGKQESENEEDIQSSFLSSSQIINFSFDNNEKKRKNKDSKNETNNSLLTLTSSNNKEEKKKEEIAQKKLFEFIRFELDENSSGISFEENAYDFIKYVLFFSFCQKEVFRPKKTSIKFIINQLKGNLDLFLENDKNDKDDKEKLKSSIQFDMSIKDLSKEELIKIINNISSNCLGTEKLKLNELKDNEKIDILIEVFNNYHKQSQDKFQQISTYLKVINFLNKIKEEKEYTELNFKLCHDLYISESNEKFLIIITNGSYLLINKTFEKYNEFYQEINNKKKYDKEIESNDFSFEYNSTEDKILSIITKKNSINNVFFYNKNPRNIPNLRKFIDILRSLDNSKIKYCFLFLNDDMKNNYDNNFVELIKLKSKFENKKLKSIKSFLNEEVKKNELDFIYKNKINIFINSIVVSQIKIKSLLSDYYKILESNNNFTELFEDLNDKIKNVNLLKNNKVTIYVTNSKSEEENKLKEDLSDLFTLNVKEISDKNIQINYEYYRSTIRIKIDQLMFDFQIKYTRIFKNDNSIFFYFFNKEGFFSHKNISKKITYDINKYFNKSFSLEKFEPYELLFNQKDEIDQNLFENLKNILKPIISEYQKLIFNKNVDIKQILEDLISNYKSFLFYKIFIKNYLFNQLIKQQEDFSKNFIK